MKLRIPAAITTRAARQVFIVKKHSPSILFVGGVVGVGATVYLACRATLQLEDHLTDAEKDIQTAQETLKVSRTSVQYRKDMTAIYITHAARICKLYAPAATVGVASICALTGSHNILSKRNAGLTAAYAATEKAFREYRERIVSEYGEEKEREIRLGSQTKTIVSEDEKGPFKEDITVHNVKGDASLYARIWGRDTTDIWSPESMYNHLTLQTKQRYLNDMLRVRGFIFLNEVYKELGLEQTPAGQIVGWMYKGDGDGFIDFGCWDKKYGDRFADFVTGREDHILLDFNVDGPIWELI